MDHIDPSRAAFDAFKALPRDTPIEMLNLVRFNAAARYPAGHALADKPSSGADAYQRYGEDIGPIFAQVGGSIVWRGEPAGVLIGPAEERWDTAFIARYPSAAAFLGMISDPAYQRAVIHRQAAVLTSRLIRMNPAPSGDDGF